MTLRMVSDDERREVAERLRRAWANVPDKNSVRHHMRVLYEIYAAVGLNDDGVDAIDLFDRLADLIEPSDHIGDSDKMVDREALLDMEDEMFESATGLALISELEEDADLKDLQTTMAKVLFGYADRIREACGEV